MAKINYCNNKDMLAEIHKSKKTFCSFSKPEYSDYDAIVSSVQEIPSSFEEAIENRAKRLSIAKSDIKITDLIFRVPSWDHIPEQPPKDKKEDYFAEEADELIETEEEVVDESPVAKKHVRPNFPPFVHYRILSNGELELVGKSHWKGDLETGEYCREHGKVTNTLAMMWMKICDRYATAANYRNYSYNEEMRGQAILQLTMVGLQFDESKSENPFAFYSQCVKNSFNRILNFEKKMRNIRDDLMEIASLNPSFTRQNSEKDEHGSDDFNA